MANRFIAERSSMIPSSHTALPAML
jgi:hypothetical protein